MIRVLIKRSILKTPYLRQFSDSNKDSSITASSISSENWNWIPPQDAEPSIDKFIATKKGVLLTSDEIRYALEQQKAGDVVVIPLHQKLDTISEFIIASGKSKKHLRKMSDSLVEVLRARELKMAPSYRGAEGEKDHDWLLIDCHNIVVHLLLPKTRRALNLEDHWSSAERPCVQFSHNEMEYEAEFERMVERYPVPADYNPTEDDERVMDTSVIKRL